MKKYTQFDPLHELVELVNQLVDENEELKRRIAELEKKLNENEPCRD